MGVETTTEVPLTTTVQPGLHIFECQVDGKTYDAADPNVPLDCKIQAGPTVLRVTIVINKTQLDLKDIQDKNVKIVVNDFMLMEMPTSSTEEPSSETGATPK